jgi:hypothetical protein
LRWSDHSRAQPGRTTAAPSSRAKPHLPIVEDPDYQVRLLDYVKRYRADRSSAPPVRQERTLRNDPHFAAAEKQFATLPGFIE